MYSISMYNDNEKNEKKRQKTILTPSSLDLETSRLQDKSAIHYTTASELPG